MKIKILVTVDIDPERYQLAYGKIEKGDLREELEDHVTELALSAVGDWVKRMNIGHSFYE